MAKIIEVSGLTKVFRAKVKAAGLSGSIRALVRPEYREVMAVRGVDITVEEGEMLALIGPNGAGKSTTIKMLTGILQPSGGQIKVMGLNPTRERKKLAFRIGSVFGQKSQLWFHLPPVDSFRLLAGIYEIEETEYKKRLGFLTELFDLRELLEIPVRQLSLGQRIRCEVAASLLHRPAVVFLDEPTIGLDVVVKQKLRDLIVQLNREEKTTILLTSHDISDIEYLCRRAIIVNHGQVVLDEPVKNLKYNFLQKKIISVKYQERVTLDLPGVKIVKEKDTAGGERSEMGKGLYAAKIEIDIKNQKLSQVVHQLMNRGEVLDINISDEPLEDIIAAIYTRSGRGGD